jgi:hypothetical protein
MIKQQTYPDKDLTKIVLYNDKHEYIGLFTPRLAPFGKLPDAVVLNGLYFSFAGNNSLGIPVYREAVVTSLTPNDSVVDCIRNIPGG